ncbi:hypothetical protein AB1Y20_021390 [Prymnesium parvum]|uniref:Uncharacterized protein n=1 Tax=Prymnesium parvum TaxID=97485 RepID=A0AB34JJI3_PRYPA
MSSALNPDEDGLSAVPRGSRHKLEELKTLVLSVLHRYSTLAARTNAERWRVSDLFDEHIQPGQSDTVLDALVRHHESQMIAMEYRCETSEKLVEQERVRCRSMEQRAQVAEQERGQLLEHSERQQQDVQRMVTTLEKQVRERAARQRAELESAHRHLSITQASLRESEETKKAILEELEAEVGLRQRAEATYELGQKAAATLAFQVQAAQDELNGARSVIYRLESRLRIEQENHRYQVAQQQLERGTNDLELSIFREELSRVEHEVLMLAEQKCTSHPTSMQQAKEAAETAGLEHEMLFLSASSNFEAHPEAMEGTANWTHAKPMLRKQTKAPKKVKKKWSCTAPVMQRHSTQGNLSEEQDEEDVRRVCVGEKLKNMANKEELVAINGFRDVQIHEGASRGHEELKSSSVCSRGLLAQVVERQKETDVRRPWAVEALEDIAQGQENLCAGFTCNMEAKAADGQRKAEIMQMKTVWDDRQLGGFSEPGSITCSPMRPIKFANISADEATQEASVSQAATQGDSSDTKPATPMGVEAGASAHANGMDACRGAHPSSVAPVFRPFGSMGPDLHGQPLLRKPRSRTDLGRSGISPSEPLAPASRTAAPVSTTVPQAAARQYSAQKGSQSRSGSKKISAKLEVRTLTRSVERPHQKSNRKRRLFSTADCKPALGGSPLKELDLFAD